MKNCWALHVYATLLFLFATTQAFVNHTNSTLGIDGHSTKLILFYKKNKKGLYFYAIICIINLSNWKKSRRDCCE